MRTKILSIFTIFLCWNLNLTTAQTVFEEVEDMPSDIISLPFGVLTEQLQLATLESLTPLAESGLTIDLPFPEGYTAPFYVYESPIMDASYAAQFPMIKTYSVYAVNNAAIRGRLTISPAGIRGFILSPNGAYSIHPVDTQNPNLHEVTYGDDEARVPKNGKHTEMCGTDHFSDPLDQDDKITSIQKLGSLSNGTTRRTYNVAIATTGEFFTSNCTTCTNANDVGVQATIVATINGIQVFYDRDFAIRFNLLTPVVFTDAATDPFTAAAADASRTQLASDVITANFNIADYDIGHVLHDQDEGAGELRTGGVATRPSACLDQIIGGSVRKGRGWSSSFNNTSPGWYSLTAHEFAHMFNAPHTFNGNGSSNCDGGNYSPTTAYEIASGTTIMSYSGICGASQNIPSAGSPADDFFHANSMERVINYVNSLNCGSSLVTGNNIPVGSLGASSAIPKGTPFMLKGAATDADGDQLSYSWEQYDLGDPSGSTHGFIGNTAANNATAPLFRVFPPSTSPNRTFPEINQILSGDNGGATFEPLPQVERTLNFRLNIRDNNPVGGAYQCLELAVEVDGDTGPFEVTSPNNGTEVWTAGTNTTITWDVAGTTAAPVSCANVNIFLSTDGGANFNFPLALNTPNDGTETVALSNGLPQTSKARVKVECASTGAVVFFDISDNNHTINSNCMANGGNLCPTETITAAAGNASLNLTPSVEYGTATNQYIVTLDETAPGATSNTAGMYNEDQSGCVSIDFRTFNVYTFTPDVSGAYTFARSAVQVDPNGASAFSYFSVYETNFVNNSTCTNFLGSNARFLASTGQLSSTGSISVNLTACQTYELVTWARNAVVTHSFSNVNGGKLIPMASAPTGGYNYTYAALDTNADAIIQIDANADFTDLCPGNYQVYGLSYKSSSAPPDIVAPTTLVGKSLNEAYGTGECIDFSDNYYTLNITGTPTLTANISASATTICPNGTVNFTSSVTGSPTTYEWTVVGESTPFATTANASNTFNSTGVFTVELVVSDGNCFATATQVITVDDNAVPTLNNCPTNINVNNDTGNCNATVTWTAPTATDDCDTNPTITSSHNSGDNFPVGTTTVTYTATDAAGRTATCSFDITVVDNEDPTLTNCPTNMSVNNSTGNCSASVTWTPPTIADNCPNPMLTSSHNSGDNFPVGTTTVTYTATDAAGRTATCSFDVTVVDNEDPTLTNCPTNMSVNNSTGNCSASVTWTPPTIADNCPNPMLTSSHNSGDNFPVGTTTVTYTATDAAGRTATCSFDVTVVDNEDPTLTNCPTNMSVNNSTGNCSASVTWSPPTIADNCPNPMLTSSHNSGDNFPVGTTTVTYTATDAAGRTATCSFDVTVVDNEDPTLTNCPTNMSVNNSAGNCNASVTWTPPSISDNCPNSMLTSSHNSGDNFPVGTTTVTYTATDAAGRTATCSFDVTVVDNEDPTLTNCPTNMSVNNSAGNCSATVTWTAPSISDNCPNPMLTSSHNSGDNFPVGTTTVTYTATDAVGRTATCSFDVTVTDNEDPVISNCPMDITMNSDPGDCAAIVNWTAPSVSDNCPNPMLTSSHNSGSSFNVGTTTVTYTATDAAGKTTTCTFDVTVVDNEPPTISCPNNITVNAAANSCDAVVSWTAPTGQDNCSVFVSSSHNPGQTFPVGVTTVMYNAMDGAFNNESCSFTITVIDAQDPVLNNCPSNMTINTTNGNCEAMATWTPPTVADNCPNPMLTSSHNSGDNFPVGTTTVTYTATDAAGRTATCSFNITVVDNEAPTLTNCPTNMSVNNSAGSCNATVTWTPPTITDNCPNPMLTSSHNSGDNFSVGTTTVTYTATDAAGGTATCSFDITVTDNESPVMNCQNFTLTLDNNGMATLNVNDVLLSVTDNCATTATLNNSAVLSKVNFDTDDIGSETVTLSMNDGNGNSQMCTPTITIQANDGLPVNLIDFQVALDKNTTAQIRWQSGEEERLSHYLVQRSTDAINWTTITEQTAQNQSLYQLQDINLSAKFAANSTLFYRLQMIDIDGSTDLSPIRQVQLPTTNTTLEVYPNPTKESIFFTGNWELDTPIRWQLTNLNGQLLQQQIQSATNEHFSINLAILPTGVYYLRVQTGEQFWLEKVVKI